jgi:hypothetical protein
VHTPDLADKVQCRGVGATESVEQEGWGASRLRLMLTRTLVGRAQFEVSPRVARSPEIASPSWVAMLEALKTLSNAIPVLTLVPEEPEHEPLQQV